MTVICGDGINVIEGSWDVALHDHWQGTPDDEYVDRVFAAWRPVVTKQFAWIAPHLSMRRCYQ